MFWEHLDKFKDVDFIEAIKNCVTVINGKCKSPILSKLQYIFVEEEYAEKYGREDFEKFFEEIKNKYNDDLIKYKERFLEMEDIKEFEYLVDYLLLILMANTRYSNVYIRKYAEKYKEEMEKKLSNEVNIWEFIKIASLSRDNDLHLERLDLKNGQVNIYRIKETYAREVIRVKLKELVDKIKKVKLPEDETIKNILNEIENYLKDKVKFESIEGIKALNYRGEIPLEWHPPCIRGILRDIQTGGSPSHYARRSFVVYWFVAKFNPNLRPLENGELVNISALDIASEEEIEKFIDDLISMLFKNVEDFDEKKTRYYISHNIGYKVAGHITHCEYCKNWKDDGGKGLSYYCNPDEICRRGDIIHPLDYLCYNINIHLNQNKKTKINKS
ncbi:hypothetical protein [Methanotorris formicicus]|uniref:DNA primase large subunit PriL n=1 Tax=Methanotorris formicicus Mc-S-70 TaxID=647171 RepID=H1L1F6_9EURY|nr:hypothetical protein [Methanotorris formicicus]EHP83771.1 DNA primase, large subunit [Methanotorris formicicus Mc-S-70]